MAFVDLDEYAGEKVRVVAEGTAGHTYKQQLNELYPAFNALTGPEKIKSAIQYGYYIYRCEATSGTYSTMFTGKGSGNALYAEITTLTIANNASSAHDFYMNNAGTTQFKDLGDSVAGASFRLIIIE